MSGLIHIGTKCRNLLCESSSHVLLCYVM